MHPGEAEAAGRDPYDLLRRLRRTERRIGAIRRRWRAFRDDPDPERLARVRRQLDRAGVEVDRLVRALEASRAATAAAPARAESGPAGGAGPPSPRDLVDAARDLDAAIGAALREWNGARREPHAPALERLVGHLDEASSAAHTLVAALAPLEDREPPEPDHVPADRQGAATLDALLAELRSGWDEIRRRPTRGRATGLGSTIGAARSQAASLLALAASDSPLASPEALRYLAGAGDAVRFRPYRDESTGAYNAHGFAVAAGVELDRCSRYGRSLGLILLTLEPSEAHGVRPIVGSIRELLRGYDVVGRISGSELALGLPESDGRGTRRIAARLLRALDAAGHRTAVRRLDYVVAPEDAGGIEALLAAARGRRGG
jgi:hypothetical protein